MQRIENKIEKTKMLFLLIICDVAPERKRDRGFKKLAHHGQSSSLKNRTPAFYE
jgi:hypothetical protein